MRPIHVYNNLFRMFYLNSIMRWKSAFYKIGFMMGLIYLFNSIWATTAAQYTRGNLLIYLVFCESVLLSINPIHRTIFDKIHSNELFVWMMDPTNIITSLRIEALLTFVVHFLVLFVFGYLFVLLLYPMAVQSLRPSVLWLTIAAILSGWFLIGIYTWLGLLTHWIGQPAPIALVVQKLSIIMGGVLAPLTFYPDTIRKLCEFSPFGAMLFNMGKGILNDYYIPEVQDLILPLVYLILLESVIHQTTNRLRIAS